MNGLVTTLTTRLLGFRGADSRGLYKWTWDERRQEYDYADALYDNKVYGEDSGCRYQRELFKRIVGRSRKTKQELVGHINPIAGIVDCYRNCINGRFGSDLMIERDGQDVPAPLQDAVKTIWRDSRLDQQTEAIQYFGANYGPSFLRIFADPETGKVRVAPLHPRNVIDFQANDAGAIVSILLEYEILTGPLGEDRDPVTYRELLTKDEFSRWKVGDEKKTKEKLPNALGICPVVLIKHADKGREQGQFGHFGLGAWNGSDDIVHLANIRMSQLGLSIDKALWAKWFIAAAGDSPDAIDLGGEKIIAVKLNPGDAAPQLKAIVEPINAEAALKSVDLIMTSLIARQPEMVLDHLESLSGQSGETIRKLLTRVTTRILDARSKYEAGLSDALRQAVSWRVMFGLEPSIGAANREAADAAYEAGDLDFQFTKRPALPPTADEVIVDAKAQYAERSEAYKAADAAAPLLTLEAQLKVAGHSDADAKKLAGEKQAQLDQEAKKAAAMAAKPAVP